MGDAEKARGGRWIVSLKGVGQAQRRVAKHVRRQAPEERVASVSQGMAIDWIGQFRETTGLANAPSIRSQAGAVASDVRGPVADYLDAGLMVGAVPGLERDVLGGPDHVLPASLLSDGRYVWRSFLGHYVRNYGVAVPPDLIELAVSGVRPAAVLDHAVAAEIGDWIREQIADGTLA